MNKPAVIIIFLLWCSFGAIAQQQTKPVIKVSGKVTRPLTLTADDLTGMKRDSADLPDHDGGVHHYSGMALIDILSMAGAATGDQLRGKNMATYVLVKCADGYQVLFSLAELDPGIGSKKVILADRLEGGALPADRGPFRLVAAGEKRPARSAFQVQELIVNSAND